MFLVNCFACLTLVLFLLPLGAKAEDTAPKFVRVPVFFITDRALDPTSNATNVKFGPHRKYIGECHHDPYVGLGYCVVENTDGKTLNKNLLAAGWSAAGPREKEGSEQVSPISAKEFDQIQDQFYSKVRATAVQSNRKEIILFAHGYKNSFEAAYRTAARFSYTFETPVILYSWPSVSKLRSYSSDENNNEWSQEHFNDVLVKLEETCNTQPSLKLRIFAHSMGSRLVVRGTPFLREKPHVVEAALICPDIDQGLVKHYARRYLSTKGTATIRLYMSRRDKALAFSQILHGGYCRLGECADSISSLIMGTPQAKAAGEDAELMERIQKTKHRMQTIDFTVLDSGAIGHKIPVDLIMSMSYANVPGDGLQLVTEQSGERSRMSNVFSRLTKLKQDSISPADTCFRVVKVAGTQNDSKRATVTGTTPAVVK